MSLFKDWGMKLLVIAVLLSIAIVWQPWRGLNLELRGVKTGIDLSGGTRVTLKLEVSEVTIKMNEPIDEDFKNINDLATEIADNLLTSVKIVLIDREKNEVVFEIGQLIDNVAIERIIGGRGNVINFEKHKISSETWNEVVDLLLTRVDPAGLLGVQARPAGTNLVLFEIPAMDPDRARALLERQGRLEAFIENILVLRGADIERVYSTRVSKIGAGVYEYEVPLRISQEGADRFAVASDGKADYPLVIYLDRPEDAVLILNEQLLNTLPADITYDNNRRMFNLKIGDFYGYYLLVASLPINTTNLSYDELQALQEIRVVKTRAILLGDVTDYSENVVAGIRSIFTENNVEFIPRTEGYSDVEWITRACGLQSAPQISPEVAGKAMRDVRITGRRGDYDSARDEAEDLKAVLSQRLPIRASIVGTTSIPARMGAEFASELEKAAIAAILAVGVMVYLRYRRFLIVGAIMITMGCNVLITLGAVSVIQQTIGLAEIGGLLAVIGIGVEHQLIITDEVLRGEISKYKPRSIMWRVGRAFLTIFVAAMTTIAAMIALFFVGFGVMKGFAIVTSIGILITIVVTRPAYEKIVNSIITMGTKSEKTSQAATP